MNIIYICKINYKYNKKYKLYIIKVDLMTEKIQEVLIEDEMKKSYLSYALSVIVSRALPDVRDGLKPVQRRILYSMYDLGVYSNKSFKKCARIVGDVIGKYHPHGDSAVYEALVRMAQDFSMNYPLIEGHGNFGSLDGDPPAAMRYTEARLSKVGELMLEDIDKDTVDFMPNFDGSLKEPVILPAKFPNLLVNGSMGIAVGMSTNIPPHNLNEIIDALIHIVKNEEVTIEDILTIIKGPDFPTGGEVYGDIEKIYKTGKGIIKIRGKYKIEEDKRSKKIVFYEIPYQTNKSKIIMQIADLIKDKKIQKVIDLRDETDREGLRIVIELKKDVDIEFVLNQLFKYTDLEISYGVQLLALLDNVPMQMTILDMLKYYLEHRIQVIKRKTQYLLNLAKERQHILIGLLIALDDIDNVVDLIKKSKDKQEAKQKLIEKYNLSEKQADGILNMSLSKLTGLETEKLLNEKKELDKKIEEYFNLLNSKDKLNEYLISEFMEIKEKFGKERKTEVKGKNIKIITKDDLIQKEDVVVFFNENHIYTISKDNFINRIKRQTLKSLFKGKKIFKDYILANTAEVLYFFTNKGRLYKAEGYKLKEKMTHKELFNKLENDEKIISILNENRKDICFVTKKGYVKRILFEDLKSTRNGTSVINIDEDDELVNVFDLNDYVFIFTKNAKALKFNKEDIRISKKGSGCVVGIVLEGNDYVINAFSPTKYVITLSDENRLNCVDVKDYPTYKRSSKGVKAIKLGKLKQVIPSDYTKVIVVFKDDVKVEDIGLGMRDVKGLKFKDEIEYIVRYLE